MLLSQGVLKHVGQRSSPGLNPDWLAAAGKRKPHTSMDFCDHGWGKQDCKAIGQQSRRGGDILATAAPAIPAWGT